MSAQARGANPRQGGAVAPELPAALNRPLGVGAMPSRPLSAKTRPGGSGATLGPSATASAVPSTASQFRPPDSVVAPTKPRVLGGGASRGLNREGSGGAREEPCRKPGGA